jgi:PAS domain S-box-containing protein
VDLETRQIVDANKAASDFYGWSNEQLKQMKIDDFDILSAEEIENKVNKVRNSEKLEFHLQHKLSDGSIRDVNVFNSIIEIKGKKYIDAIIYDITDRKKAERELENYKNHLEELVKERTNELETQYEFLRTLIDNIPNPVFIKDKDFKYTDMNSAFERFFGNSRHGLIGKTHYDLLPKKLADYLTEKDEKLLKEPGHQFYEVALQNAKGILTPVIFYKSTFTDTNGNILGIIGLFVDISNRKKMEEQINEALEKERELNEIKNNFLSLVSHEFRTPLTSILSSADLLELYGRTWEKDKYYKYVEQIQRAVDEMSKMLDDVSTLNKADRGKILFNPADIDLYHFACDLIEQIRTFTQSNQEAVFDYRADDTIYHLDEKLLRQILMNLLTNAIKYSPDGGKIYLNVKSDKKFLIFKVKDQGMGISNSDKEKLFDPFFRSSEIQNISGSGLGLSIVQKALELHGGTIKVESELGKGSTFTVKIPIISK